MLDHWITIGQTSKASDFGSQPSSILVWYMPANLNHMHPRFAPELFDIIRGVTGTTVGTSVDTIVIGTYSNLSRILLFRYSIIPASARSLIMDLFVKAPKIIPATGTI